MPTNLHLDKAAGNESPTDFDRMRRCTKCGDDKPVSEFNKNKSQSGGLASWCRLCVWEYQLERNYDIKTEVREQMLIDQGFRCQICNEELEDGRGTCVDHNHKTGVIREILCSRCNRMLGVVDDNPAILESAANYLYADEYAV